MAPEVSQAASRRIGTWVRGKYQLDAVLGEGGMAVVYAATHRNKKRFAVKMLRSDLASAEAIRRFLREGYVANSVEHEGAVAVLDDDIADDGSAFLVMELLEGCSIEALADDAGKILTPRIVLAIAHQLLDVLASAHAKGVVHRDVKPANLFLTRGGRVKVLDFGIARLREASDTGAATRTGVTMGTPSFMAPEQARGKASQIGELTDVWAAGATMFTLLSGKHVHEGESPQELVVTAATTPPRSLSVVSSVPEAVVQLVDRALEFDPAGRWPSAAAMRDAIGELHQSLYGAPVPAQIDAGDHVAVPASDPSLRADRNEGLVAPTVAFQQKTVALPPRTQEVAPIAEALRTTGEPVAHTGPTTDGRSRVVVALAAAMAIMGVVATILVLRGRRAAEVKPVAETVSTVVPAAPPPSVSEAPPPTASVVPSASASPRATSKPRPPSTRAAPKPNDWDHQ
jgi:serine/threonine protein kinase